MENPTTTPSSTWKLCTWIPFFGFILELAHEEPYLCDRTKPIRYICGILYHVFSGLYLIRFLT